MVDLDDGSDTLSLMAAEEEEEEEMGKASSNRSSFGFRVALQFPTKKSAGKQASDKIFSKFCLTDSKPPRTRTQMKNNKIWKKGQESSSEEDTKEASKERSTILLKRAMNIKENKAMVRPSRPMLLIPNLESERTC